MVLAHPLYPMGCGGDGEMRSERRFEMLAGPMSAEEFISGDYPVLKLREKLVEFAEILESADSIKLIRAEFNRIFKEPKE